MQPGKIAIKPYCMRTGEPTTPAQKQPPDPYQVIREFFDRYNLRECQVELWRLLSAAFASEDADHWDRQDRGNTVFFCRNVDEVLKALYEIKEQLNKNPQA